MKKNTNGKGISIHWKYTIGEVHDTFIEENDPSFWEDYQSCGFGEFLVNFKWVESITKAENCNEVLESFDLSYLSDFIEIDYEKNRKLSSTIFYESIRKLVHIIYNKVKYFVRSEKRPSPWFEQLFFETFNVSSFYSSLEIYTSFLKRAFDEIQEILNTNISGNNANDIITKLGNLIDEYANDKKSLFPRYVFSNSYGGCVAAYIFDVPQLINEKSWIGYLAFSGYNDIQDDKLAKMVKPSSPNVQRDFINKLYEISSKLNFKLVTTNFNIEKHSLEAYTHHIKVSTTLEIELNKGKSRKDFGKDFACCERKIFTEFYTAPDIEASTIGGYYVGRLYVKFNPCDLCSLGILYEHQLSHIFTLMPSLSQ